MAVLVALVVGIVLGYKHWVTRWPFLLAGGAIALELVVNGIRFGADSVIVWGVVLSFLTVLGGVAGLRVGTWLRNRNSEGTAP